MNSYLNIYIGTSERENEDFLYLDLVVGPYESTIDFSPMEDITGDDFLRNLGDILNTAELHARALNIPLRMDVDQILTECIELCFKESTIRNIKALMKEVSFENTDTVSGVHSQ